MDVANRQILIRRPDDVATAVARHKDELAKIATSVTNDEKRNPKIARETRDWEATVGDGLERKQDVHAKPKTR